MKRLFSSPVVALAAGLCLRLWFVLKFPADSGDTVVYEQIATNWLKRGLFGLDVDSVPTPVDLRMPGYPAFLAFIYAITGKTGPEARLYVMLAQIAVDLITCCLIAALAVLLTHLAGQKTRSKTIFSVALWFAALCPFTANYTAVILTETFAVFWTVAALLFFALVASHRYGITFLAAAQFLNKTDYRLWSALGGLATGIATLFRPESPLLLVAVWITLLGYLVGSRRYAEWLRLCLYSAICCVLPLLPWAARNAITFREVQLLAPKNSNLPGEFVPRGFMAWEKTWLIRMKDCYLVPWKLNGEPIHVEDIPARAFDTADEKQRVAKILEDYNEDLALTAEQDSAFAQIARERNARHPLRTHLWIPLARALVIWFTPRIELLPISGHVFPLRYYWEEDPVDQRVTAGLFFINILYLLLAVWGAARIWRHSPAARPTVALFALYILLRTAFLTTLETPEPRYVLVCFPLLIALAAHAYTNDRGHPPQLSPSGSG